jgi:hypothetical protein
MHFYLRGWHSFLRSSRPVRRQYLLAPLGLHQP